MERPLMKVFIREQHWTAYLASLKLGKKDGIAITLFNTIYLNNCSKERFLQSTDWVRHEVRHIQQYKEKGYLSFLFLYLWYSIRYGYYNNPFEVDARNAEKDGEILKGVEFF